MAATTLFISGCDPKPPKLIPTLESTVRSVIDSNGDTYLFISPERTLPNGEIQVELWEKIAPHDTQRWYTPTLASRLNTNQPPTFNPLLR